MAVLNKKIILTLAALDKLIAILCAKGFEVIGPVLRDGVIVVDRINGISDLPKGVVDHQEAGSYSTKREESERLFAFTVGPQSCKHYLRPPVQTLWKSKRLEDKSLEIYPAASEVKRLAFFGIRSCELHAMIIQDKVFMGKEFVDEDYKKRRENIFIVALNCTRAGNTCFCTSMNTGPKVSFGFDLALTEVCSPEEHFFVAEVGSLTAEELIREISHRVASLEEVAAAERLVAAAANEMGRSLETKNIRNTLCNNLEHPRWEAVAERCLSCTNCTMVCPTCFCSSVDDISSLSGNEASRVQKWDSCFSQQFSYIHGGTIRCSVKSRYRQWLTHKFATWIDQFGTSGCVGCGRCITWCPVGIDVTEEIAAIRES